MLLLRLKQLESAEYKNIACVENDRIYTILQFCYKVAVADPGENLTGALHSNFWRGGCGGVVGMVSMKVGFMR